MKREEKPIKKDETKPDEPTFFDDFWPIEFQRNRFGFFDEFEEQFKRMEQQMNNLYNKALQENSSKENNNTHIYGWTYRVGPDGQPHFQEFGNLPKMLHKPQQQQIPDRRDPHLDVQEGDKEIYVTIGLPGVHKEDINLEIDDKTLRVQVSNKNYPYNKEIPLHTEINEKKTDATYINGILSITLEKTRSKKKGRRINIK